MTDITCWQVRGYLPGFGASLTVVDKQGSANKSLIWRLKILKTNRIQERDLCRYSFSATSCLTVIRGAFKTFVAWHSHKIATSYFVNFQHGLLQLECTWSSIFTKLGFRCRRIVDLALLASNNCRADNIVVVGKFAFFHDFLQFRKWDLKILSDTNPTFIGAVYWISLFIYLLIYNIKRNSCNGMSNGWHANRALALDPAGEHSSPRLLVFTR